MLSFIFVLFILHYGKCADTSEFKCTSDFCLNYDVSTKCPTLDIKCLNDTIATTIPTPIACTCCETCLLFQDEGASCINGSPGQAIPPQMCGPGLVCESKKCVKMDSIVIDPLKDDTGYTCESDTCFCSAMNDTEKIHIFGSFPKNAIEDGKKFCGCSALEYQVRNMKIRALPFEDVYQPFVRCLPDGKFDPLQCYEEFCRCVDPETGVYDDTIPTVSIFSLGPSSPLCFNETAYNHTRSYYHDCERLLNLLQKAKDFAEADGFQFMFPFNIECRPDGEYLNEITHEQKQAILYLERNIK